MGRLERIAAMTWSERRAKVRVKLHNAFSPHRNLRRLAFALDRWSLSGNEGIYCERPEYGPVNIDNKFVRLAAGGPFEPFDVTLVNKLAVRLAGEAVSVLEVGCGTAMFASMLADCQPATQVVASEFDDHTRQWAVKNRNRPNVTYCKKRFCDFSKDEFALCVALEVIEHIDDYPTFLREMAQVAPRAIVSTPNKFRNWLDYGSNTPAYEQHTREWSAGEFFWVLRCFWTKVEIYTIPNIQSQIARLASDPGYEPTSKVTGVHSREHALIAVCEHRIEHC